MLAYFPRIYPDELLYSVLARYHRHTCSPSPKHTLDDLFGCRTVRATVDLPGRLGALGSRLPPDRKLTPSRLALEFTLFPYHIAFQPAAMGAAMLAALIEGPADSVHVRLGIAASTISAPKALRFCPVCHADALARWGERYWRRAHQLAGVLLCPDHATPLVESTVILNPGHQQEFVAATAENCRLGVASASWSDDERRRMLLQEISVRSAALLTTPPSAAMFEGLAARYRQALIGRNLATAGGRVDQDRLHSAFEAVFSPLRPDFPAVTKDRWLSAIVRKHRHAFHPLHHILFGLFLDRYPNESGGPMDVRETDSNRRRYARNRAPRFADRLRELVGEGRGLRATARALSVDPNTIRFRAERLGLTTPWRPRPHRIQERSLRVRRFAAVGSTPSFSSRK